MEKTGTCCLERRLSQLKSTLKSKDDFLIILFFLRALISDLINNPTDGKYKTISKDTRIPLSDFMCPNDIKEFFLLLGYHEERDQYLHHMSDQNRMILESCLELLDSCSRKIDTCEHSDISSHETGENVSEQLQQSHERSKNEPSSACEESKAQENTFSGKLKNFFLKKHQKKEECPSNSFFSFLKCEPKTSNAPEITYNSNGYFHQLCKKRGSNQNDVMKDLFHTQERSNKKWGCSPKV